MIALIPRMEGIEATLSTTDLSSVVIGTDGPPDCPVSFRQEFSDPWYDLHNPEMKKRVKGDEIEDVLFVITYAGLAAQWPVSCACLTL